MSNSDTILKTLPNLYPGLRWRESHIVALPPCCPVSHNPRPGSTLIISYEPGPRVLEIGSLYALIMRYQGGLRDNQGELVVRDMEGMILTLARACYEVLQVSVLVEASLVLLPKQRMLIEVRI